MTSGTVDDAGAMKITDRLKDLIKSGGEWISSIELEDHLTNHPAVAEAAVIAVPDPRWEERPLAVVRLLPGASVGDAELRQHLSHHVAKWQLPEYWARVEAIPKTGAGKTDKQRLRARFAAGELDVHHRTLIDLQRFVPSRDEPRPADSRCPASPRQLRPLEVGWPTGGGERTAGSGPVTRGRMRTS